MFVITTIITEKNLRDLKMVKMSVLIFLASMEEDLSFIGSWGQTRYNDGGKLQVVMNIMLRYSLQDWSNTSALGVIVATG